MKKVRYTPADPITYINLTVNKIYDVITYTTGTITLLDDDGIRDYFPRYSDEQYKTLEFIDATHEYRDEVINEILK